MQILRTLIIIAIIFYVIPWFMRKVGPVLLKRFVEKRMGSFQQQFQQQQQAQAEAKRREGEVHIKRGPSKNEHVNNSSDIQDVDFEEIK